MNGTVRQRNKVQRGLKKEDTAFIDGNRIYYNFLRPHLSLGERTPAEKADIKLDLEGNRWMKLIKKSLNQKVERTSIQ